MAPRSIAEWMEGKDVLITGATGFMGKVLVEKLLRACPGVNRLFLIIRMKKNRDAAERMMTFQDELFQPLLKEYPNALDKLVVIPGDLTQPEIGISKEHQELLKENVSVVFHCASSVRFDNALSYAFKLNARGTFELLKLAKQMKKLDVFQYVSTAYSNSNLSGPIEEKVYPTHVDWQSMLSLVDKETDALDLLTYHIQFNQPNTYTLTKSIGENMVLEASKEIPCVIVRPSIVTPIYDKPLPGWTDNLNGIVGMLAGVGKGILRVVHCNENSHLDLAPVDIVINGMIAAAWSTHLKKPKEADVFNETYNHVSSVTNKVLVTEGLLSNSVYPMDNKLWFPFLYLAYNTVYFHILFFIFHIIPALILDLLLTVIGRKPMVLGLNTRIYNAMEAMMAFSSKFYDFNNQKYRNLFTNLCPEDQELYSMANDPTNFDRQAYITTMNYGVKKYFFHEKDEDQPIYKDRHQRYYYLHIVVKTCFHAYLIWELYVWGQWGLMCFLFGCQQ